MGTQGIRRIVHGLRLKALDELGLVAAVAQRVSRLRAADGRMLHVEITAPDTLPSYPPPWKSSHTASQSRP